MHSDNIGMGIGLDTHKDKYIGVYPTVQWWESIMYACINTDYSLSILFYSLGSIFNYIVQILDDANSEMLFLILLGSTAFTAWILR